MYMYRRFGGVLLFLMLLGCGDHPRQTFKGTDISGAEFGRGFRLTDHNGRRVGLQDFRGKLVVMFFGYTHCPDVCPTTLSDMSRAMGLMRKEDAARVQVLFVSVDPERDTPEILKSYVPYFHQSFLGLYGTAEEVASAAKEFRVMYRKHTEPGAQSYLVDHSAGSYVFDRAGRLRLYLPFAHPPQDIAQDLTTLLLVG